MGRSIRDNRQLEIAKNLIEKKKGSIQAVTGFGKTRCALLALAMVRTKITSITVLVPTNNLEDQWNDELKRFSDLSVSVMTYSKARKLKNIYADVVIVDEAHNAVSEQTYPVFKTIESEYLWCLSATLERNDQRHALIFKHAPLIDEVTIEEAEKNGYVSEYTIYNLPIDLTGKDKETYQKIDKAFQYYFAYFSRNLATVQGVLKNPFYAANIAKNLEMETGVVMGMARKCMKYMKERQTFLNTFPEKLTLAREIAEKATGKVITFHSDINSVVELTKMIGKESKSYHSKQPKKTRENIVNEFNKGSFRVINTARALDEGADIQGLETAIVCAGTSVKRQSIQRLGRIIRASPGKQAVMVNIYIRNSQEEKWLNSRLGTLPCKTVESIEDINL